MRFSFTDPEVIILYPVWFQRISRKEGNTNDNILETESVGCKQDRDGMEWQAAAHSSSHRATLTECVGGRRVDALASEKLVCSASVALLKTIPNISVVTSRLWASLAVCFFVRKKPAFQSLRENSSFVFLSFDYYLE